MYVLIVPAPTIFRNQLPNLVHPKANYAFAIPYFVAAIAMIERALACYGFWFSLYASGISNFAIEKAMYATKETKYVFTIPYFGFVITYLVLVFAVFALSKTCYEKKFSNLYNKSF
jgi:hypothetical protein